MTEPMPYARVRKEFANHPVRFAEVPVEHFLSLPVPTMRWQRPGFAGFACPATRSPGQPQRVGAPDRWWALQAHRARLLGYGLVAAIPLSAQRFEPVTVDRRDRSVAELEEDLGLLAELMDGAVAPFLAGERGDETARGDLREVFTAAVTPSVLPWYQALAPDFLAWLENGTPWSATR